MKRGHCSWTILVAVLYYCCNTWGFLTVSSSPKTRSCVDRQPALILGALEKDPQHPEQVDLPDQEATLFLENLLFEYGWGDRIVTLSNAETTLPMLAEIQQDGAIWVGKILWLEFPDDPSNDKPPKFIVELLSDVGSSTNGASSDGTFKIDMGQLTTIWSSTKGEPPSLQDLLLTAKKSSLQSILPLHQLDRLLEEIYETARHRATASSFTSSTFSKPPQQRRGGGNGGGGASSSSSWTKKELQQRIDQIPTSVSFSKRDQIESVLRQIAKAGPRHDQLVDSEMLARMLPSLLDHPVERTSTVPPRWIQRAHAGRLLDESGGGRFKRLPCLPLSSDATLGTVTVVNGGWLAVDSAVRAASEARALAQTGTSRGTNADERIVQRLEYLAMSSSKRGRKDDRIAQEDLQMDVREYLKAMDLPFSTEGAKEALIQMGIWSKESSTDPNSQQTPQPWSPEVLKAVEWYQAVDRKRNERLANNLIQVANQQQDSKTTAQPMRSLEGRIDLTHLPCVCVDAARTSFRDDAIGVRPRASTGRKVSQSSKWEILLHTVDVSDLYAPTVVERSEQLRLLQSAAAKRGSSRYDLPSGPLHLLPPSLLETLSLQAIHPDNAEKPIQSSSDVSFNRCMTLWVYIDETTGEILDSGLERTLISTPLALTFQSATDLLEDDKTTTSRSSSPSLGKAKALLGVAQRDLSLWSDYRRKTSTSAKAREDRLKAREQVDRQIYGDSNNRQRDDGRDGFRRTRGHRLVDMCLEVHGYALTDLLKRAKASLPYVAGAARDGRVATAPLRRYIDGMAQRQALSVLCGYGGKPLSNSECVQIGQEATKAVNAISNIQSFKPTSSRPNHSTRMSSSKTQKQQQAARALLHKLSQNGAKEEGQHYQEEFLAMSTGKQSEVVILGVGAIASCRGIQGTLKPGEKVTVRILNVDPSTGQVKASLLKDPQQMGGKDGGK
jgi:hypothetical protein